MNGIYIYLGGPVALCTGPEAHGWRQQAEAALKPLIAVNPLRFEPPDTNGVYDTDWERQSRDPKHGTSEAIFSKNWFDVQRCDFMLANFPKEMNVRRPSIGTICEVAWAKAWGKPVVLVTDDEYYFTHPVLAGCASWRFTDLQTAIDLIREMAAVYVTEPFPVTLPPRPFHQLRDRASI